MATLKGTWRFNDPIQSWPDRYLIQEVAFECMETMYNEIDVDYFIIGYDDGTAFEGSWIGDNDPQRTISFVGEQEVSTEFYDWFTANATKLIMPVIKSGTYRFNDVLTGTGKTVPVSASVLFTTRLTIAEDGFEVDSVLTCGGLNYGGVTNTDGSWMVDYYVTDASPSVDKLGLIPPLHIQPYDGNAWLLPSYQTITLPNDSEVSTEFAEWFSANANPTVRGKWKLNSTINCIPYDVYEVGAASPEQRQAFLDAYGANIVPVSTIVDGFTATVSRVSPGIVMGDMYEDGQPSDLSEGIVYEADVDGYGKVNGWESADYFCGMTVDFGDELQAVSEVFYNWLIENAVPVADDVQISGTWKFKDTTTSPADAYMSIFADVSFMSNGKEYIKLERYAGSTHDDLKYWYSDAEYDLAFETGDGDSYLNDWASEEYKTISFVGEQTVSAEFFNWLTENATLVPEKDIYYSIKKDLLTNIANSIRAKTGKTDKMSVNQMSAEIDSITGGECEKVEEYNNIVIIEQGGGA